MLERHLQFRDRLRASAALRAEHEQLKRDLATRLGDDREAYTEAKAAFVDRVCPTAWRSVHHRAGRPDGGTTIRTMKIIVIGATGTIGGAVADELDGRHEVVRASRRGEPRVNLADRASIAALLASVPDVDAIVCCAASAPLTPLGDDTFVSSLQGKLLGQVELVRHAIARVRDRGSITLTSGRIPEATPGSAGGALTNAGLEAFVAAAAIEMPREIRLNAVSPGWVKETLVALGMDGAQGTPASEVARAYVDAVEGTAHGRTIAP